MRLNNSTNERTSDFGCVELGRKLHELHQNRLLSALSNWSVVLKTNEHLLRKRQVQSV